VIRVGDEPVTLVNVIDVDAAKQQVLADLLIEGTEKVLQHRPGFVSVNLLASNEGTRVPNHAQWRSQDDVKATMADPGRAGVCAAGGRAGAGDAHVYSVVNPPRLTQRRSLHSSI
jgi:heme-degrading monooxygenase HmoA